MGRHVAFQEVVERPFYSIEDLLVLPGQRVRVLPLQVSPGQHGGRVRHWEVELHVVSRCSVCICNRECV